MTELRKNRMTIGKEILRPKAPFCLSEFASADIREDHHRKYQSGNGIRSAATAVERHLMTDKEFLSYVLPPLESRVIEPQERAMWALWLQERQLITKPNAKKIIIGSLRDHVDQCSLRGTLLAALERRIITKREFAKWFSLPVYHSC